MQTLNVSGINVFLHIDGPEVIVDDEDYEQPTCNQPWNKGKRGLFQHTEESKSKITGRPKGFVQTDEWKENKSKSMRGNNNHFYGKNHTDEVREKITQSKKKLYEKTYQFVSPIGEIVKETTTLREFCRKYNLDRKSLTNVINKIAKHHKGWTLYEPSTIP
jgi:23S rRNA A1618 N6-methylase RlmF